MSVSRPVHVLYRMVASVSMLALLSSSLPAQTAVANAPQQNAHQSTCKTRPRYRPR